MAQGSTRSRHSDAVVTSRRRRGCGQRHSDRAGTSDRGRIEGGGDSRRQSLALKFTVPPNDETGAMVTVYAAFPPCATVWPVGVDAREKSGAGGGLKKIPFTTALAPAAQVTRMVT